LSLIHKIKKFNSRLRNILLTRGRKGLVLYLKTSAVLLQQSISGHYHPDGMDIGARISRTSYGLPRIISANHRILIRNKRPGYTILIKFYLTIFSIYRVLPLEGIPKLSTITDPGKLYNLNSFTKYMHMFKKTFIKDDTRYLIPRWYFEKSFKVFSIYKSSPQTSIIRESPLKKDDKGPLWSTHPTALLESCAIMLSDTHLQLFNIVSEFANKYAPILNFFFKQLQGIVRDPKGKLGKLAFKEEAAGKVRVFALVDPITQWLLYPLHKHIFAILRRIPMDGTFNQLKPVWRLLRRQKVSDLPLYSLDLSAATDRMPVSLQAALLDELVKEIPNFGQKWSALLTNRVYYANDERYPECNGSYRYAVGQPMGALSSWGMLALTHHFIVQVAAWRAGFPHKKLFKDYAVLGDDLVIGNTKVKDQYLKILDELGMSCGLHKSLLSKNGTGLEFAKSTFVDGVNVSPISFKELAHALTDLSAWSAFSNKFNLKFSKQAHILGYGYLARRKSFTKLNHALQCVSLALVAKSDFNTQSLKLRRGSNIKFDGPLLDLFKLKVLKKVSSFLMREMGQYIRIPIKKILLKKGWDFKFKNYDPSHYVAAYNLVTFREGISIVEKLKLAQRKVSGLWKIQTFDQALETYLKVLNEKAVASLDYYLLKRKSREVLKKTSLPYQLRMFRAWSRVSHKVIKLIRSQRGDE